MLVHEVFGRKRAGQALDELTRNRELIVLDVDRRFTASRISSTERTSSAK